jgi:diketogulonate reductase-like aldo/keto reductase
MQRTPGPLLFYGTSGKGRATERLTRFAIERGFRALDSALHFRYAEDAVGAAIAGAIRDGIVRREELFLQTKFTYDVGLTVAQSFATSLERLRVDAIDSYVLHAPLARRVLSPQDIAAWREMESLPVRFLGVSNVAREKLEALCAIATVKPAFVQNRCLAATRWDAEVRAFCRANGIVYQGFSLISANPRALESAVVRRIAGRVGRTPAQVVLRFAQQAGVVPLVGTTKRKHMREALAIEEFELTEEDVARIERGH